MVVHRTCGCLRALAVKREDYERARWRHPSHKACIAAVGKLVGFMAGVAFVHIRMMAADALLFSSVRNALIGVHFVTI